MSYSRWSNSRWYIYWSSGESGEDKEEQVLSINDVGGYIFEFSYKELKDSKEEIFKKIGDEVGVNLQELLKLKEGVNKFMKSVDEEYG